MDGYNPQRQLLEQTRQLVKKWEPTGLLEGMEDDTKRHEWQSCLKTKQVS